MGERQLKEGVTLKVQVLDPISCRAWHMAGLSWLWVESSALGRRKASPAVPPVGEDAAGDHPKSLKTKVFPEISEGMA